MWDSDVGFTQGTQSQFGNSYASKRGIFSDGLA
jgi:hypothetical protein